MINTYQKNIASFPSHLIKLVVKAFEIKTFPEVVYSLEFQLLQTSSYQGIAFDNYLFIF
jgi:hypothetical protein